MYADQIEHFCRHFSRRKQVCISVHTHNDRGTGIASAELALLAGAERVEGCLFGNGERTGNADLVTLALNLYTRGHRPAARFQRNEKSGGDRRRVQPAPRCTTPSLRRRTGVYGVFRFASGCHQKGFAARQHAPAQYWDVPYLPLDPADVGCSYEAVIRVNSQSGKSGAAWLLEQNHGLSLPRKLQQAFSQQVQHEADRAGKEMSQMAIWNLFRQRYGTVDRPALQLIEYTCTNQPGQETALLAEIRYEGKALKFGATGNGFLSAAITALCRSLKVEINIESYHEHTLGKHSDSRSVAYVCCENKKRARTRGVSIDSDITRASLQALLNAAGQFITA